MAPSGDLRDCSLHTDRARKLNLHKAWIKYYGSKLVNVARRHTAQFQGHVNESTDKQLSQTGIGLVMQLRHHEHQLTRSDRFTSREPCRVLCLWMGGFGAWPKQWTARVCFYHKSAAEVYPVCGREANSRVLGTPATSPWPGLEYGTSREVWHPWSSSCAATSANLYILECSSRL